MISLRVNTSTDRSLAAPAEVLLRWVAQRGIAVIPKSGDIQRISKNLSPIASKYSGGLAPPGLVIQILEDIKDRLSRLWIE